MASFGRCVAPSNPIVGQVAKKYNITRDKARTIINNARAVDYTCRNDSLTLEALEQTDGFRQVISNYTQHLVDAEEGVFSSPDYAKAVDDTRRQVKDELDIDLTREEAENLSRRAAEINTAVRISKVSTAKLAKLVSAFKDMRRLNFLGSYMRHVIDNTVHWLEISPEFRQENGVKESPDRAGYFSQVNVVNLIRDMIWSDFDEAREKLAGVNDKLAGELQAAIDSMDTMLYMYGSQIFMDNGVRISPYGAILGVDRSDPSSDGSSAERNYAAEGDEETNDTDDGINGTSDYSTSDENKSVMSKVSEAVKAELRRMKDGADPYGYGLSTFTPTNRKITELLNLCRGAHSFNEMARRIGADNRKLTFGRWFHDNVASDEGGEGWTQKRRETMRTLFFLSAHKSFINFRRMFYTKGGVLKTTTVNSHSSYEHLLNGLKGYFNRMSGAWVFYASSLSEDRMKTVVKEMPDVKEVERLYRTAGEIDRRRRNGESGLSLAEYADAAKDIEDRLLTQLKRMGFKVTNAIYTAALTHDNSASMLNGSSWTEARNLGNELVNLLELVKGASDIAKHFLLWSRTDNADEGEMPNISPLIYTGSSTYSNGETRLSVQIYNKVSDFLSLLTDYAPDTTEASVRLGGKNIYAFNNPVTAEETLSRLMDSDDTRRQAYMAEKYGQDRLWYLMPYRTGGRKFYSVWLQNFWNGSYQSDFSLTPETKNSWHRSQWSMPSYSDMKEALGKDYYSWNDRETLLLMLRDYFVPESTQRGAENFAKFRMFIASDKKSWGTVRYRKMSDAEAVSQAEDFFAQELARTMEVVRRAAGTGNRPTFKNYDIKVKGKNRDGIKSVLGKVKDGGHVSIDDVLYEDADQPGVHKYLFRNTGASFFLNKFLVSEIEGRTELGKYIVDRMFNQKEHAGDDIVTAEILPVFRDAFRNEVRRKADTLWEAMDRLGLLDGDMKTDQDGKHHSVWFSGTDQWFHGNGMRLLQESRYIEQFESPLDTYRNMLYDMQDEFGRNAGMDDSQIEQGSAYFNELAWIRIALYDFVQNNWMAKANMSEIFNVDLAYYGKTTEFQKRNSQEAAAGYSPNPDATIQGRPVSDGKYRSITVTLDGWKSQIIQNLLAIKRRHAATIQDPAQRRAFEAEMDMVTNRMENMDVTDGQAFTTPTGLRKRKVGLAEWTYSDDADLDRKGYIEDSRGHRTYIMTDEAVYWRFRRGEPIDEDWAHVFTRPMKPFVSGLVSYDRGDGTKITVPVQYKNSEYALIFLLGYMRSADPQSPLEALFRVAEESADDDPLRGIDSINFDSAQKIGVSSEAIDLTGLDGAQAYAALKKAIYGEKPAYDATGKRKLYRNGAVTEYDISDYKIVQQKPEHFRDAYQPLGSQIKILAVANIADNARCTLSDGTMITGRKLKERYFKALMRKTDQTVMDFSHDLGLDMPRSVRMHRLSNWFKRRMMSDQQYGSDTRLALSVETREGVEQFAMPLDDPSVQNQVESMLLSGLRSNFYRQKTRGGIVVQASSWGASNSLNVRFYSSNPEDARRGGVVPTLREYLSENTGATKDDYARYLDKWQEGYSWFECELPMPDYIRRRIDAKVHGKYRKNGLINDDGTWNMDKVKEIAGITDKELEAICYRVPTEGKHSIMACKCVRFSPEGGGSVARYPLELVQFTGSDFDIDMDTVEMRPDSETGGTADDVEIFEMQMAALKSDGSLQETFHDGDFSDLKDLSYRITLLRNGWTAKQLDNMDDDEIKDRCMEVEDLDLMDAWTDVLLHDQNSDAKYMIGIAAVGVTSHAFNTVYNTVDLSRPERDPRQHPENFLRVAFPAKSSLRIVNDSAPGGNATDMTLSGDVFFDMVHNMDGNIISQELKYVGASADAAKDAALFRLGLNRLTLPYAILMHRLGISSPVARLFISHPAVRALADMVKNDGRSSIAMSDIDNAILNISRTGTIDGRQRTGMFQEVEAPSSVTLKYSELLDQQSSGELDPDDGDQVNNWLGMLQTLKWLQQINNATRNLDAFTRYNSSKTMDGATFLSRYTARRDLSRLTEILDGNDPRILLPQDVKIDDRYTKDEVGRLFTMFPHIAATVSAESELAGKLIVENMHTYTPLFFSMADRLLDLNMFIGDDDRTAMLGKLYAGWKHWLLFYGDNAAVDFKDSEAFDYYTKDFPLHFGEMMDRLESSNDPDVQSLLKDNSFIESLSIKNPVTGGSMPDNLLYTVQSDTVNIGGDALEKYWSDWCALLGNPKTRKIAVGVAIHFLARYTGFSRDTAATRIPIEVKRAIPHYSDVFEQADKQPVSDAEAWEFLAMFQLNNAYDINGSESRKFFPNVPKDKLMIVAGKDPQGSDVTIYFNTSRHEGSPASAAGNLFWSDGSLKMPVIRVYSKWAQPEYYYIDGNTVIEKPGNGEPAFDAKLEAHRVLPLGIPGVMQEYRLESLMTGSAFQRYGGDEAEADDGAEPGDSGEFSAAPVSGAEDEWFTTGSRIGASVSASPYGDDEIDAAYSRLLASDSADNSGQEAYLESRTFLKRMSKAAKVFGFSAVATRTLEGGRTTRGIGRYGYTVALSGGGRTFRSATEEHMAAMEYAAVVSELGMKESGAGIRTYTKDSNQANAVEFSVPLKTANGQLLKKAASALEESGIAAEVDFDGMELRMTVPSTGYDSVTAGQVQAVRDVFALLKDNGLTDAEQVEFNYAIVSYLDSDGKARILDNIINRKDEQGADEQGDGETGTGPEAAKAGASPAGYGRIQTRDEGGVKNLAGIALRRVRGEKVDGDIRSWSGDSPRLAPAGRSLRSQELVSDMLKGLDNDILDEVEAVAGELGDGKDAVAGRIGNLIVNTANWIIGGKDSGSVAGMFNRSGLSTETASSVMDAIKEKLDKENIC